MNSRWKRLILAACLSVLCASLTFTWYFGAPKNNISNNSTPLAQVSHIGNEVLRRPLTRLLWQQLSTGDNIYNGETIRTSEIGEITLQFKDGRYIEIEPDSLFVMEKTKDEIALNLLEGSLFVDAKKSTTDIQAGEQADTQNPGLVLNSPKGKIDLNGSSVSLTKSESGNLDFHVLEGNAKLKSADGTEEELHNGKQSSLQLKGPGSSHSLQQIEIISPESGRPVFTHADIKQTTAFEWTGAPIGSRVSLLMGLSRKSLKQHPSTSEIAGAVLKAHLEAGKYWWKLVAKNPASGNLLAESSTERLEVRGRLPPTLYSPTPDAVLEVDKTPAQIEFKWQRPPEALHTRIEIFTLDNPTKPMIAKELNNEEATALAGLNAGDFNVRLSASYPEYESYVVGSPIHFVVKDKTIAPVRLVWNMPEECLNQSFVLSPQLELKWSAQNRENEIAIYHVSLNEESAPAANALHIETKVPTTKAVVPKAGRYIASIEAFDKNGQPLARLVPLNLEASELPRLDAPILQPPGGILPAESDGRIELQWTAVQNAKEYEIHVTNPSGRDLNQLKTNTTKAKIKNLMPGEYIVRVQTVDQYGRVGHEATARRIKVPETSGIRAPTLKKIKVD